MTDVDVVVEGKVELIAKTGGDVIQNPSDLDATDDGHTGSGDQIQWSETCSAENDVPLIVGAIPETACASDANAVQPRLEQRQSHDLLPVELTADTAYGGDDNGVFAESLGVESHSHRISTTANPKPTSQPKFCR